MVQNGLSISKDLDLEHPEVKKMVHTAITDQSSHTMDRFIDHHSNWHKLKKCVGWILVAMRNLRRRSQQRKIFIRQIQEVEPDPIIQTKPVEEKMLALRKEESRDIRNGLSRAHLTNETYLEAERALILYVQKQHFTDETHILGNDQSCEHQIKGSSKLHQLNPIKVDGLLRVGGRLDRASIPYDAKHQVILPKDSHLSELILREVHKSMGHLGKNAMLNVVRQRYWIIGVNPAIKSLLSKCVTCRKYQARASQQKMADLPEERLAPDLPCFVKVGMDYFGPIAVKRGRTQVKRYGVIFTCMTSRAVHLEVACSMDTDSCINAIRRFIARRGPVNFIRSDNGTNLVGSEREMRQEIERGNQSKIHEALLQKGITWAFNPPSASHFGGVWERLIRSVRKVLYSLLQLQVIRLDDEALQTLFCEVEAILNGHPLTALPNDPGDFEALTPNHLLLLRPGKQFPPGVFCKTDNYVKRRWRQVQYLADLFWCRWLREYLPLLQERQKWILPRRNISIGDVVLVVENTPRNSWALARVLEVVKDKKGFVRVAKVKTKSTVLLLPVDKLCLVLEADDAVST